MWWLCAVQIHICVGANALIVQSRVRFGSVSILPVCPPSPICFQQQTSARRQRAGCTPGCLAWTPRLFFFFNTRGPGLARHARLSRHRSLEVFRPHTFLSHKVTYVLLPKDEKARYDPYRKVGWDATGMRARRTATNVMYASSESERLCDRILSLGSASHTVPWMNRERKPTMGELAIGHS